MAKQKIFLMIFILCVLLVSWIAFVNYHHQTVAYRACESLTIGEDQTTLDQLTESFVLTKREDNSDSVSFAASEYSPALSTYLCEVRLENRKIVALTLVEESFFGEN
ncbi:MAG: hypothetical protein HWE27_10255 [Gammaproteobacteria bacterium]|nr:hypothetical protein [Gammaproteobacteria bacterium]